MVICEVRNAVPDDHARIDALAMEAWQILKDGYNPEQWNGMLALIGKMSDLAGKGPLIVAAAHCHILGAVAYIPAGAANPDIFPASWPSIRMLVTDPAYRNLGIGRKLTEACIDHAKRDGAACIGLHTSPVMTVALPLYLRMGFVKDKDLNPIAGAPYARYVLTF